MRVGSHLFALFPTLVHIKLHIIPCINRWVLLSMKLICTYFLSIPVSYNVFIILLLLLFASDELSSFFSFAGELLPLICSLKHVRYYILIVPPSTWTGYLFALPSDCFLCCLLSFLEFLYGLFGLSFRLGNSLFFFSPIVVRQNKKNRPKWLNEDAHVRKTGIIFTFNNRPIQCFAQTFMLPSEWG